MRSGNANDSYKEKGASGFIRVLVVSHVFFIAAPAAFAYLAFQ